MDNVVELEHSIQDTNDVWSENVQRINQAITEAAIKNGIKNKNIEEHLKFKEFNLTDMVMTVKSCKKCWNGTFCKEHEFKK